MRVRWTESAARDLTSICDYTEEHSGPEAARKVAIRVFNGWVHCYSFRTPGEWDAESAHANSSSLDYPSSLFIVSGKISSRLCVFCTEHSGGPDS